MNGRDNSAKARGVLNKVWRLEPKWEEPAARKAQASSSSNAPAGVDAGSTAPDVPMDPSRSAPSVRQDEVSAMEGTSSSAVVTETVQGVMVVVEYENK